MTVFEKVEAVPGLISEQTGDRLANLAMGVPSDEAIVEIGSYKGRSTCFLAAGAEVGGGAHVYAIDAWNSEGNVTGRFGFAEKSTLAAFTRNIGKAGFKDSVTPIKAFSTVAALIWDKPIGLLFIDGSHLYEDVKADFLSWQPHLTSNATVVFDDYDTPKNPGVKKAVDEFVAQGILETLDLSSPPLAVTRCV